MVAISSCKRTTPFPARAGMNRVKGDQSHEVHSVPRTRGDEPAECAFPDLARVTVPRTRGDEPFPALSLRTMARRSPHARG